MRQALCHEKIRDTDFLLYDEYFFRTVLNIFLVSIFGLILLITLTDLAANCYLPIINPNIETALWARAYPSLVADSGAFSSVVREG